MGTPTRQQRRTKGLSEVQESVLEHSTPETQEKDLTPVLDGSESCKEFDGTKIVTSAESRIPFTYVVKTEMLENPDRIKGLTVTLPSGVTAKFIRSGGWA
jgi:hypothetical protein